VTKDTACEGASAGIHDGGGRVAHAPHARLRLRVAVDTASVDREWDAFLATTPGGSYLQTSRWGRVKAYSGWAASRIKVYEGDQLIAGCQLLLRIPAGLVAVGYVTCGPLFRRTGTGVGDVVLDALDRYVRRKRFVHLKVQPPAEGADVLPELMARGFVESPLTAYPRATTRIDLRRDSADLLASVSESTRRGIRSAERRGVVVRPGTEADLPFFRAALLCTARRQGFTPYAASYYERMWRIFAPGGHAHLLIAEHEGVPLSSQLLLAYNDTVTAKVIGWSGERSDLHPNRALDWASIQWAAERYTWYDFDGIDLDVARSVLSDERSLPIPGPQRYKLSFGGEVVVLPPPMDRTARLVTPGLRVLERSGRGKHVVGRLRGRQHPAGPS
jgi:peptidoglycan pentaglycine glycine transferase (the first glycine)